MDVKKEIKKEHITAVILAVLYGMTAGLFLYILAVPAYSTVSNAFCHQREDGKIYCLRRVDYNRVVND